MPNNTIPDWKKAAIATMSKKYGDRSLGRKLDLNYKTVRKYRKMAEEEGVIEMDDGFDLEVVA